MLTLDRGSAPCGAVTADMLSSERVLAGQAVMSAMRSMLSFIYLLMVKSENKE